MQIYNHAAKILIDYSADSTNKMKPSKKIKRLLKVKRVKFLLTAILHINIIQTSCKTD